MTTTGQRWAPSFAALIQDPAVNEEFKRLAAAFNAVASNQTTQDSEAGLDNGNPINTRPIDDSGKGDNAIRWLRGPWLLGPNGASANYVVIRPPMITHDLHNYSPLGIREAIGLELTSDATGRRITGIDPYVQATGALSYARRLLFVFNAGQYAIHFPNDTGESIEGYSLALGTANDVLVLPPGRLVWFYFDAGTGLSSGFVTKAYWRLFALPAVPQSGWPASLTAPFPPDYDWFGSRVVNSGTGASVIGIGEQSPSINGTSFAGDNQTTGMFEQCTTAAGAGGSAGITGGAANQIQANQDPTWTTILRTGPSIANIRIWVLFTNGSGFDADADPGGLAQYFGFRYSTVAADGGWVGVTRDAATQSVTTTVGAIAASTTYKLRVRKSGATFYFSVNDGTEVPKTSNPPGAAVALKWFATIWTQDAVAKSLSWSRHTVKFGIPA